uniref:Uncharacterized protein n=1 Tax=Anguilla anguilla TaxID=7936 RepID=A0A0E9VBW9_ANGAN
MSRLQAIPNTMCARPPRQVVRSEPNASDIRFVRGYHGSLNAGSPDRMLKTQRNRI